MNEQKNFAANLDAIRKAQRKTLEEFADELGIARSTVQSIIHREGKTYLETAVQISDALHLPLSSLLGIPMSSDRLQAIHSFLLSLNWYTELSAEDQKEVSTCLSRLLEVLQK